MAKLQEKHEKILKELRGHEDNKKCFDCTATFPSYVVIDFGTWVCTTCSGIHREFSHKIKSISMATFKPEEIKSLQQTGNAVAEQIWRYRCSTPKPDSSDISAVRSFIKQTYVDKKWYKPDPSVSTKQETEYQISSPSKTKRLSSQVSLKETAEANLISFDDLPTITSHQDYMLPPTSNPFNPFLEPSAPPMGSSSSLNPFLSFNEPSAPPLERAKSDLLSTNHIANSYSPTLNKQASDATLIRSEIPKLRPPSPKRSISPSPARPSPSEQSTTRPDPSRATSPSAQPTVLTNTTPDTETKCPVCQGDFIKGISNDLVNRHIDDCLNNGGSRIGLVTKIVPATLTPTNNEDPWSQWFDLSKMEWYFGNIDRKKAEDLLRTCNEDAFLVRKSSRNDSYAISLWNYKKQSYTHALIEPHPKGGYRFQGASTRYSTIKELIEKAPECRGLKPPSKLNIQLDE